MSTKDTRAAVARLMTEHGATRRTHHGVTKTSHYWTVATPGGELRWDVHIAGTRTSHVSMDRFCAHPLTEDLDDGWLDDNVWPYGQRYCNATRRVNTLVAPGFYSALYVLTDDVLDLLRLWVPRETAWQHTLAEDRMNSPTIPARRDGIHLVIWCEHCRKEHWHGLCHSPATGCKATLNSWDDTPCTCPLGQGDGHRVAHCHDPESPYYRTGYVLREEPA